MAHPDDFKQMVDVLHQHGIAVIVDIVWNHLSPTDNYLWNYDGSQTYFDTPVVDTPWGSQADFDKAEVRDYYVHSALQWLEEFKVDGYRMDATAYMDQGAHAAAGYSLMQRFDDALDSRWADKVTIAEELPNDAYITRPTSLGGAGFDSQYYDYFTDNLRQEIQDAAFGSPEMFKITTMINGSGTYLNKHSVFNYLELHDEVWPSNGGQRMVKTIDTTFPHDDIYARGRSTLAQGIVMLAPGVPAIHQGNEWLEDTGFGADAANRIDWAKKNDLRGRLPLLPGPHRAAHHERRAARRRGPSRVQGGRGAGHYRVRPLERQRAAHHRGQLQQHRADRLPGGPGAVGRMGGGILDASRRCTAAAAR